MNRQDILFEFTQLPPLWHGPFVGAYSTKETFSDFYDASKTITIFVGAFAHDSI